VKEALIHFIINYMPNNMGTKIDLVTFLYEKETKIILNLFPKR
jgi:hypothetical protein